MEKININKDLIKIHNIVITVTSSPEYNMSRLMLIDDLGLPSIKYNEYVVAEGYHCSCYDFNDTEWEFIKYDENELLKLAESKISNAITDKYEKVFYRTVELYLKEEMRLY